MQKASRKSRIKLKVTGLVQGVGFRPFVHNLARDKSLSGFVRNNGAQVDIEIQGKQSELSSFLSELESKAPPLAQIKAIERQELPLQEESGFFIDETMNAAAMNLACESRFVAADSATCRNCLSELFDQSNRRFRYPFINCCDCGPRFSIIKSIPFDRAASTMAEFQMCSDCLAEYENPENRRFHCQANCCPECGPQLEYFCGQERASGSLALERTVEDLKHGKIIAAKGLSGFHLICDATNEEAVSKLRERKRRSRKPFALMMRDLEMLHKYCNTTEFEKEALLLPEAPIVLLSRTENSELSRQIAPGIKNFGVMLPYTPLQHLLLGDFGRAIVASSANLSEEPIVLKNQEAIERLSDICDSFLFHNRDIHSRYDDSVIQFTASKRSLLRRARGIAPLPLQLNFSTDRDLLAFGAHLKSSFCILHKNNAYLSQHIGDLENLETEEFFLESLAYYLDVFKLNPEILACDLHPDYLSSKLASNFAMRNRLPLVKIQHHHAHIAACMLEHSVSNCIGIAFDGLGYGTDHCFWGGEFFFCDNNKISGEFSRLAHFDYVKLPGASKAIKEPFRMALSYIDQACNSESATLFEPYIQSLRSKFSKESIKLIQGQIRSSFNSPLSSSCGRLFDAVASLCNICHLADFEGQAAMELESQAWQHLNELGLEAAMAQTDSYPFNFEFAGKTGSVSSSGSISGSGVLSISGLKSGAEAPLQINFSPMISAIYSDLLSKISVSKVAFKFHLSLAQIIADTCIKLGSGLNTKNVCLGGGVFQNRLLYLLAEKSLRDAGFEIFISEKVPVNDGGISLGQAALAYWQNQACNNYVLEGGA